MSINSAFYKDLHDMADQLNEGEAQVNYTATIPKNRPQVDCLDSFTYDRNGDEVEGVITYTFEQPDSRNVHIRAFVFVALDSRQIYDSVKAYRDAKEALRNKWSGKTVTFND